MNQRLDRALSFGIVMNVTPVIHSGVAILNLSSCGGSCMQSQWYACSSVVPVLYSVSSNHAIVVRMGVASLPDLVI